MNGKKRGMIFDPHTKLLLLLTITTLMFSTSNKGIMNVVKPVLSLVPFGLILSERQFKTAGKYLGLYAICFLLERAALNVLSGMPSFLMLAVTAIMTRFVPGMMMVGRNPFLMVEYRLVPLMVSVVKIGDELSAAALTRGLGAPVKRTNVCRIGFHVQDMAAILLCFLCFVAFFAQKYLGV